MRIAVVSLIAACGRIGFDPLSTGDGGNTPMDAPVCTQFAATDPPASGGGYMLVRAWGSAPNAPAGSPTTDSVELAWEDRTQPRTGYVVVRTECGAAPDIQTFTPCTATTSDSCLACTTGLATRTCVDAAARPSPARVRYQVVIVDTEGSRVSESDDADFTVDVPTPPPNMVLVHRASVNREMCDLLGAASDRTQHQHCPYVGFGGVPLRAHPDSPNLVFADAVYDFGYDLFVDRWEGACNWTHAADGGMCGPGAVAGDCASNAPGPDNSFGVDGNVFYSSFDGRCFVKIAGGWQQSLFAAVASTNAARATYTNDPGPGHDRPPIAYMTVGSAAAICGANSVPVYGAKRTWRLREFVAAAAFARLPGDPGQLSAAAIATIESGSNHPATHGCNVQTHNGVMPAGFRSGDELARDVAISIDPAEAADMFLLGSVATESCTSRYGVQDAIGNSFEVVSDQFAACGTGMPCVGMDSTVDAGNVDLTGFALDGVTGAGPNVMTTPLDTAPLVMLPLAMPLAATAPFGRAPDAMQTRGDESDLFETGGVHPRMGIVGGAYDRSTLAGRFMTDFGGNPDGGNVDVQWGLRCVVAAVPR